MSISDNNDNSSNINNNEKNINSLKIDLNDINNKNNSNTTPLKNVYSNMTSSNQSRKLSALEEKLSTINSPPDIENYYKSLKNENQNVIPQIHRMELLQKKMNLLQNSSNQNSKALQEILELQMNERLRYPKYTIIQNTPLTPHEEIVNEILKKKFGPGGVYSMNYPTVVFKNPEEINEMRNKQNSNNANNNNNNNQVGKQVVFQSNENRPITVKMLKEMQQELLNLRKAFNELKVGVKEIREQMKIMKSEDEHKSTLMIEMIRKAVETSGDKKLKAGMELVFDKKKIDMQKVKSDLDVFKEVELNDIIKDEIKIYDVENNKNINKQFEELKKMINDIKANDENDGRDENKIEDFEDFLKMEEKAKNESKMQTNQGSGFYKENENNENKDKQSKSTKKTKKKKRKKNSDNNSDKSSNEEEENEEGDESDEKDSEASDDKSKSTKTKKTKKTQKKNNKSSGREEEEEENESDENDESVSKTSKTNKKSKKTTKNNKSSVSKSKNKSSGKNREDKEESKYSHTESESQSGSQSQSISSNTKGNKSRTKKSNKKKAKQKQKSETISEKESEDEDSNNSSDEEKSKSTKKK
jgi:hypothetical protein